VFVTNRSRCPFSLNRRTASGAPGIGSPETCSTPSTSRRIAAIRLDSTRLRIAGGIVAVALTAGAPAAAATPLHVDIDGDGIPDVAMVHDGRLVVVTATAAASIRLHADAGTRPRLDGAMHVRGVAGALLLVRVHSARSGVTDAVYRLRGGRLARIPIGGGLPNGLVTAAGAAGFVDFDCGAAPETVVQISAEPRGSVWRETVVTLTLRTAGFVPTRVDQVTLSGAAAGRRRCPLVRMP
jgi:hypothetical protein